jgi:hypothetical protein
MIETTDGQNTVECSQAELALPTIYIFNIEKTETTSQKQPKCQLLLLVLSFIFRYQTTG